MSLTTRVLVVTTDHHFEGEVATEGRRLLDVMNDKTSDYIRLSDCSGARNAGGGGGPFGPWSRALVFKSTVCAVVPVETAHEAPQKRQNMMVRKSRWEVFLTLPGYDVRGFVHLQQTLGPLEYQAQLAREGQTFFPLTDAAFAHVGAPGEPVRAAVALISRQKLGFFTLAEQPAPE